MARAIAELERDIRALSATEKEELLGLLISELDVPSEELRSLAGELISAVERADEALKAAVSRVENLDEELRQGRIEVSEAVRRSGERWPFPVSSNLGPN
ncbi:MAG TPA: hypothetical protein VIM81_14515 [Gammaproteobacteria bacterium]